jgi:phosphatidylserine synthase
MSWVYTLAGLFFAITGLLFCLNGDHEWAIVFATVGMIFTISGYAERWEAEW